MLALALAGERLFSVDDSEIERGGVSYTLDTVREYHARIPQAELFWIIGGDQLARLERWRAIEELARQVTFLVLARPGYELSAPKIPGLFWERVNAPLMEESSTSIRERLKKGQPVEDLLPESVEAFIKEKGLYT